MQSQREACRLTTAEPPRPWLPLTTMMGGMMGCEGLLVGLLIIAVLVTVGIVLVRRQERL